MVWIDFWSQSQFPEKQQSENIQHGGSICDGALRLHPSANLPSTYLGVPIGDILLADR